MSPLADFFLPFLLPSAASHAFLLPSLLLAVARKPATCGDDRPDYITLTCGIDGEPRDPVTKQEFNRWVNRIMTYHLEPMKDDLTLCTEALYGKTGEPGKGLVNIRDWICKSAAVSGTIIGAIIAFSLGIVPALRWIGEVRHWW